MTYRIARWYGPLPTFAPPAPRPIESTPEPIRRPTRPANHWCSRCLAVKPRTAFSRVYTNGSLRVCDACGVTA